MRTLKQLSAAALTLVLLGGVSAVAVAQDETAGEPSSQTSDLLPGVELVTEQVEPGVFRVVSDGVRELARPIELEFFWGREPPGALYRWNAETAGGIAANEDGVWLARPEGIIRLGEDGLVWASEPGGEWSSEFGVAPDGTLYRSRRILDGQSWVDVVVPRIRGFDQNGAILFASDGSLWAKGTNGKGGTQKRGLLARRDADGWSLVKPPPTPPERPSGKRQPRINLWGVTGEGVLYVTRNIDRDVQRFDGTEWETLERPGGRITDLHVGPDGTVWVTTSDPDGRSFPDRERLLRADEEGWTTVDLERQYPHRRPAVGADGAYWYAPGGDPMTSGGCDGIARTDGIANAHFLRGLCIYDIAIGPGGDVWLEAGTWDGNYYIPDSVGSVETYIIRAEVAAVE